MTRVFQRRPSVVMHHQRSACEATTSASIVQASEPSGRRVGAATPRRARRPAARCAAPPSRVVAAARSRRRPRSRLQAALRFETTSSASRSTPTSATSDGEGDERGHALAREQHQLGAEAGTHGQQHAVAARRRRPLAQGVLEHVQHRGRGQVADAGQRVPGQRDGVARQLQRGLAAPRSPWGRRGGRPTSRCRRGSGRGRRGSRRRPRAGSARRAPAPRRRARSAARCAPMSQPMVRSESG